MGWETITYACGHTERRQMYGPMKERERNVKWLEKQKCPTCEAASTLKSGEAIKVKYSEFKFLETLGFKSVYGSYDEKDKTILVYTDGFKGKTTSGILNELYARELRKLASKTQNYKQFKSDIEKAAAMLERNRDVVSYTNKEMESIVRELVKWDSLLMAREPWGGAIISRVSKILGYDVLKKALQRELPGAPHSRESPNSKKLAFRMLHGNFIATSMPKRISKSPTVQHNKQPVGTPAKSAGQHGVRDMPTIKKKNGRLLKSEEKTRRGYCVPDTVQSYWILTDKLKKETPKKKTAKKKSSTKKETTAKKKKE